MIGHYFYIFSIKIYTYWLFVDVAFIVVFLYLLWTLKKFSINRWHGVGFLVIAFVIGFLGARVFSVLASGSLFQEVFEFEKKKGFTYLGGLFFVVPALILYVKLMKLPIAITLTLLANSLLLGYAIGRLACFFSGDGCYGVASNLPWAMSFPNGGVPVFYRVHPTPLYESLIAFSTFLVYNFRIKRSVQVHTLTLFFEILIIHAFSRFMIEYLRRNTPIGPFTFSQWICLLILFTCLVSIFQTHRKPIMSKRIIEADLELNNS